MRVHPEVAEAEARLAELREQETRATDPQKKTDLVFQVEAQAKLVDELRWQHEPRPMVTASSIAAAAHTTDCATELLPADRAY